MLPRVDFRPQAVLAFWGQVALGPRVDAFPVRLSSVGQNFAGDFPLVITRTSVRGFLSLQGFLPGFGAGEAGLLEQLRQVPSSSVL